MDSFANPSKRLDQVVAKRLHMSQKAQVLLQKQYCRQTIILQSDLLSWKRCNPRGNMKRIPLQFIYCWTQLKALLIAFQHILRTLALKATSMITEPLSIGFWRHGKLQRSWFASRSEKRPPCN